MISIGTDIVSIHRFIGVEKKIEMSRLMFTENEFVYCSSKAVSAESFAGHFAAKEALIKAFSSFGRKFLLKDIEIVHLQNGQPKAKIRNSAGYTISLSIAHENNYAIAFALVIKNQL